MQKTKLRPIEWSRAPYFACPFVAHEALHTYYCLLCHYTIFGTRGFENHVRNKCHISLLDYHGRYIMPLEHELYSCKACNYVIPGYINVHYHLISRGHCTNIQRIVQKQEHDKELAHANARANDLYDCLQEFVKQYSATKNVKAKANGSNDNYKHSDEKREGKSATNSVKAKATGSNDNYKRLGEKRKEKTATNCEKSKTNGVNDFCNPSDEKKENKALNGVKAKSSRSNDEYKRFYERKEEKGRTIFVKAKAKANKIKDDYNHFNEKREEKSAPNSEKAETNKIKDDYNRFNEKREEKSAPNSVKAKTDGINNDYNPFNEKREEKKAPSSVKAKIDGIINDYNPFNETREEKSAPNSVKAETDGINNDYNPYNEKREEKTAPNSVKAKANEINNDYNPFNEKREGKKAPNSVKAKANGINNDYNPFNEKREEKKAPNSVKAKIDGINNDYNPFNEKREEKKAPNSIKAKTDGINNDYNPFNEKRKEKKAPNSVKAKTDGINNDYNPFNEKKEEKKANNYVKAKPNQINDDHEINRSTQSKTNEIIDSENTFSASSCLGPTSNIFDVAPTTPEIQELFQRYSTNCSAKKISKEIACNNLSNDTSSTQDSGIEENTLTSPSPPSEKIVEPKNSENASTKTYNQIFVDLLYFHSDIYDLRDRVRETRLSMDLCLQTELGQIYCLVCHQIVANTTNNCAEHLCSFDLCEYREKILSNGGNSYDFAGQFGQLNLASQYMECFSAEMINCLICKAKVQNTDYAIQTHVLGNNHSEELEEMRGKMRSVFEKISSRWQCDWYKVQKYRCHPCSEKFETEFEFAEHLNSEKHAETLKKAEDFGCTFVYDFCAICAIFWCGYRDTFAAHCDTRLHIWFKRNGGCISAKLPESGQQFLNKCGTQNDNAIDYIDLVCAKEEINNKNLVASLENSVQLIFPCTKVCAFGLRISSHCVIDVFLGCETMNDGRTITEDEILYYMMSVNNCLSGKPEIWDLKLFSTGGRSPIISAIHKPTGLACDISFDNRLVIGGLKFIEVIDDIFPSCCKLMHYLSQWLAHCKLTGSQHISSYALYWLLVFYLQTESIIPSVAVLMQTIDGHQVGGSNNFVDKNVNSSMYLEKLLIGFFKYYANFDFRYDVACPLVGEVAKKRSFAYPENLPVEMGFYVAYVMYSNNPEEFPIDSPMCVQDPFNLNHNLSKNVSKVDLSNFRTYCVKTADFLSSS